MMVRFWLSFLELTGSLALEHCMHENENER